MTIDEDGKRIQKDTHKINLRSLKKLQIFEALARLASSLFHIIIENIRECGR